MPMGRNRIVFASWYDYPQYYDILFQDFTQHEADFIEAACRKYCPFAVRRLLEPACGTGRLITELATRGYELIGFDSHHRARCREYFTTSNERELPSIRRHRELLDAVGERHVLRARSRRSAACSVTYIRCTWPLATSNVHTPKSRSKVIALPSALMAGQSRRPFVKRVSCFASPPLAARDQRFSLPERSLMK